MNRVHNAALALAACLVGACFYQPTGSVSTDAIATSMTSSPQTSTLEPPSTTADPTGPAPTSTSTGTTAETDPGTTSTGTGTTETTGTTDMTSGTDSSSTAMSEPLCGDGIAEAGETCDGADLKGKKCTDFPHLYGGGTLTCSASCNAYDFTGCCRTNGVGCSAAAECCSNNCVFDLLNFQECG